MKINIKKFLKSLHEIAKHGFINLEDYKKAGNDLYFKNVRYDLNYIVEQLEFTIDIIED